jgi:hypothetical protein
MCQLFCGHFLENKSVVIYVCSVYMKRECELLQLALKNIDRKH